MRVCPRGGNMSAIVNHWINGTEYVSKSGRTAPVYDPALGTETKRVALANQVEIDAAIKAAKDAFPKWRDESLAKRQQIIFNFRELLNSRKGELAEIITSEHGKVLSDALGEITRGQEVVEFATGIPHLLKGFYSENVSTGVDVYSTRQPLGVVGIISPFNFPAMVPMWFFPIAIAAGNTVVIKPSEKDPSASLWIAKLWKEAGLPDGVFNVLNGDKESVDGLLNSPDVESISFVGSTPIAQYIYESASRTGKRVQALGGAKNHMLVLPDADLDMAADAAVSAAYGSAGERCMAVSVVLAVDSIADALVDKLKSRIPNIKVGPGTDPAAEMGPLISREHRDKVASFVTNANAEGAKVVVDGTDKAKDAGFFLNPSLIDNVKPGMKCYDEEIFGPVLTVMRVKSYQEGLDTINANQFGNGTAIFTRDGGVARQFQFDVQVGMVGINVPIPVPVSYYSFGGWKASLFGDQHMYGPEGINFFTRGKVVTSRWPDPRTSSVNLGFPQNR